MNKRVTILEIGSHHDGIYSQIRFLTTSGFEVHFVGHHQLKNLVSGYNFENHPIIGDFFISS